MKWSPTCAAAFLAAGWVHYAAVLELGGNPALVVGWLVLFLIAAGIVMKHMVDRIARETEAARVEIGTQTVLTRSPRRITLR